MLFTVVNNFNSEPPSAEEDVDVWCYAILRVACQKRRRRLGVNSLFVRCIFFATVHYFVTCRGHLEQLYIFLCPHCCIQSGAKTWHVILYCCDTKSYACYIRNRVIHRLWQLKASSMCRVHFDSKKCANLNLNGYSFNIHPPIFRIFGTYHQQTFKNRLQI